MTSTDAHRLDMVQLARRVLQFVRLLRPPAEGLVVRNQQGLDVGDAVKVRLVSTEPTRGFVDFEAIG